LFLAYRYSFQFCRWIAVNDASLNCYLQNMAQPSECVVVSHLGRHFAESARPFITVDFCNSPYFFLGEPRPALQQRNENLVPVMPCAWLDGYIVSLILLMDFQSFAESHLR